MMTESKYNKLLSLLIENNQILKEIISEKEKENLRPKEVQELLNIGKTTYQRYVKENILKQIKIGGKAYISKMELERFMEKTL